MKEQFESAEGSVGDSGGSAWQALSVGLQIGRTGFDVAVDRGYQALSQSVSSVLGDFALTNQASGDPAPADGRQLKNGEKSAGGKAGGSLEHAAAAAASKVPERPAAIEAINAPERPLSPEEMKKLSADCIDRVLEDNKISKAAFDAIAKELREKNINQSPLLSQIDKDLAPHGLRLGVEHNSSHGDTTEVSITLSKSGPQGNSYVVGEWPVRDIVLEYDGAADTDASVRFEDYDYPPDNRRR